MYSGIVSLLYSMDLGIWSVFVLANRSEVFAEFERDDVEGKGEEMLLFFLFHREISMKRSEVFDEVF